MRLALVLTVAAELLLTSHAYTQGQPQLPAKLLQARTVFIDNQSGFERARDEFVDEMGRWQRLRIVYNRTDADVIAVIRADRAQMTSQLIFADPTTDANIWNSSTMWSNQGAVRELVNNLERSIAPR